MDRNLDGVYFRIKRDKVYEDVCFSDLTLHEMLDVIENEDIKYLNRLSGILLERCNNVITEVKDKYAEENNIHEMQLLCITLANQLKQIGETFEIKEE